MAGIYPINTTVSAPLLDLVPMGNDYLNQLPADAILLKAGLIDLYQRVLIPAGQANILPNFPENVRPDFQRAINTIGNPANVNMSAIDFTSMLCNLFNIDNVDPIRVNLIQIFTNLGGGLFRVINDSRLKKVLWKLVMTDINIVLFKGRHGANLGPDFNNLWNNHLKKSLARAQLYSLIRKLQECRDNSEVTRTLIRLFNNKLSALGDVNMTRLWNGDNSVPSDLSDSTNPVGFHSKYLKYKNKYLMLKNKY